MTFIDILKAQGLKENQIEVVKREMKKSKIFITKEENIEVRYEKAKLEKNTLKIELSEAFTMIADIEKILQNYESLKTESDAKKIQRCR